MFGSRNAVPDPNAVTIADYAADARNWVRAIRQRTGASCVWLLGHSEGALVALAAGPGADDVCGLLLVASPGRPVGEVLREQLRANPHFAPVLEQAFAGIASLEARQPVASADVPPMLRGLFAPQLQPFLMDLLSHDPAAMLRKYERPVLILHGTRDLQVSEADARRLAAANPNARLTLVPGANHVLKEVASDDRQANFATYGEANLRLAPGVADAITQFICEHSTAGRTARNGARQIRDRGAK
jgi:pimeloyl-ACP methyl ester carboxylesterase